MTNLAELGQKVRSAQDEVSDVDGELDAARERFLETPARSFGPSLMWTGAAMSLVAAVLLVFLWGRTDEMQLVVHDEVPAQGTWFTASSAQGTPLSFSDGSTVLLRQGARARVAHLDKNGAHLEISQGQAVVSVVHRASTDFRFRAGPYLVEVTGTRFVVGWAPQTQTFSLEMLEGSVRVSGPELSQARTFITGQQIELSPDAMKAEKEDATSTGAPGAVPQAKKSTNGLSPQSNLPRQERAVAEQAKPSLLVSWQALARKGEHASAVQTAQRLGVSGILASASSADLLLLADSAFYSGHASLAREAFVTVRERNPGTPPAAQAAFGLGRLSQGSSSVRWFERYLVESPSGPLAREALGRILEVEARLGNVARTASAAERYLARFPGGPHAQLARDAVQAAQ